MGHDLMATRFKRRQYVPTLALLKFIIARHLEQKKAFTSEDPESTDPFNTNF